MREDSAVFKEEPPQENSLNYRRGFLKIYRSVFGESTTGIDSK
jgi:hypothetical protein